MNVSQQRISLREYLSILCGRIQFLEALGRQCEDLFGTSEKKAAD